jgi:nicotinate phosphoribosyltransferase
VTAPLAEAQLVETYLLNQITFQTAIATKAARCRLAAPGIDLVDFALRRTQGVDAGLAVARLSAIAGFVGTSNVDAARRYGLRASGTMAHSYVEAFPGERDAFRAFARDFPHGTTFLIDTYDTMGGVEAAIEVIRELNLISGVGVRLDSGDLGFLARKVRQRLDAAGLGYVKLFVSGGLDEYALEQLMVDGAPVDGAGVGTNMGVAADAPYVDSVYKLVQVGTRPVLKLSQDKTTLPGPKQVWRRTDGVEGDLLATRAEPGPSGCEPLLVPVMRNGQRLGSPGTIEGARRCLADDLALLPPAWADLHSPVPVEVAVSEPLLRLTDEVTAGLPGGVATPASVASGSPPATAALGDPASPDAEHPGSPEHVG